MASLVLGVSGAVVGSFFGQPSLGYAVGSMLGSAIDPQRLPNVNITGPKLNDRKIQISAYGVMIPIIFASFRMAGNVFWSTDVIETEHNESSTEGGKGGPQQTTNTTSYTYSVSFAILLTDCTDGEIVGIRRVWANGQLFMDSSDVANAETLIASALKADSVKIYTGSFTQLPDPTIEAYEGAGNVPGYRGRSYMVVTNMQLAPFNNSMPNLEHEVVQNGTISNPTRLSTWSGPLAEEASTTYDNGVITQVELSNVTTVPRAVHTRTYDVNGTLLTQSTNYVNTIDDVTQFDAIYCINNHRLMYCKRGGAGISDVSAWYLDGIQVTRPVYPVAGVTVSGAEDQFYAVLQRFVYLNEYVYAIGGHNDLGFNIYLARYPAPEGIPESRPDESVIFNAAGASVSAAVSTDNEYIYLFLDSELRRYDEDLNLVQSWTMPDPTDSHSFVVYQNRVCYVVGLLTYEYDISGSTPALVGSVTEALGSAQYAMGINSPVVFNATGTISIVDRITTDAVPLSDVVENICNRVAVDSGSLDVSELTDEVDGYGITRQAMARACIEPLQMAYFFDAVESDYVLKFVKRGGAVAATIPYTDLAAHEFGSEMPDYLLITKALETELPRSVNVLYHSPAAAYQQAIQTSSRQTGSSEHDVTLELPIVMSDTKGKQVSDVSLWLAWNQGQTYRFTTWLGYDHLEPTDVVTITTPTASHTLRITKKDKSTSGVLSFEGVQESSAIYTQTGTPGVAPTPSQSVALAGPTVLYLLDIPLLRDQDDGPNFYAAAAGYLGGWHGATVYKSVDDGASYSESVSFISACVIGETTTALGNWTGGNVWDEGSTVDVQIIGSGTLSSTTETNPLYCLIGNEICAFKNASLIATKKYRLTGLLRGRRGTDWAQQGHTTRERFVLLNSSTLRLISGTTSEIGVDRKYKGVSIGTPLALAQAQIFNNTGAMLKPLKPTHIGGGRTASGDVIINWVRQARTGWKWRDFVDVDADSTETYEIEILDTTGKTVTGITNANPGVVTCAAHGYSTGDYIAIIGTTGSQESVNKTFQITVIDVNTFSIGTDTRKWNPYQSGGTARKRVRTLTSTTRTATYTSAQQTTDFGGNQSTIYVNVYPVSTTVGRGFPGYTTI